MLQRRPKSKPWAAVLLMLTLAPSVSALPDLVATKSNDVGGQATLDEEFVWTIVVENRGDSFTTTFGIPWLVDNLPQSGVTLGSLTATLGGGATGFPDCALNADPTISCAGQVTLPTNGTVTLEVPVTPTVVGGLTNPRGSGVCNADPISFIAESDEGNNACSDSLTVSSGATGPDLVVAKTNGVGGATEVAAGSFIWSLQVGNGGDTDASFSSGQTIVLDNLPSGGVAYGSPSVSNQTGIGGTGSIGCTVMSSDLECSADGGTVILAASTGSFMVELAATPTAGGILGNPRAGGVCAVDPDDVVPEDAAGAEANNTCSDSVSVADSADLVVTKTNSVMGAGTVGEEFDWLVEIENTGAGAAVFSDGLPLINDELPDVNVSYGALSTQLSGSITGTVDCAIDASSNLVCLANGEVTMAPLASLTVTVPTTPTAAGEYANPRVGGGCDADRAATVLETDEENNTCADTVMVTTGLTGPDLVASKSNDLLANATELAAGAFSWSVQVTNGGDTEVVFANGQALLRDHLPASGLDYGSPQISDQTDVSGTVDCTVVASDLVCTANGSVTFAAGSGSFTVQVPATPTEPGEFANPRVMGVCAADPDDVIDEDAAGAEANNTCTNTVTVTDSPDLTATKSNSVEGVATLDEAFTWSIEIQNTGGAAFQASIGSLLLVDNLPDSGMSFGSPGVSASTGLTGTLACTITDSNLACLAAEEVTLETGGGITIAWLATPTEVGSFENPREGGTCAVDPSNVDLELDETNNECADTVIVPSADLQLTKSDSTDPVVGSSFGYTLRVDNLGPSDATNVEVLDTLPEGLDFVSGTNCTETSPGVVACSFGTILAGSHESRMFEVEIDPEGPGQVTNSASVTADQADPDPGNNDDSEDTTLDGVPPQVTFTGVDGQELAPCGSVRPGGDRIELSFSESMADPGGDDGANDVTNPDNYLLLIPGDDGSFQTMGCGPPAGDDQQVQIEAVVYDGDSDTTLSLAQGLGVGLHRLYVCSELQDLQGNPLDGDGDGTGGDDALFTWRVEDALLVNGNFDCDLEGWDRTHPEQIFWSQDDVDASDDSGSAGVANLTASTDFALSQCVGSLHPASWELRVALEGVSGDSTVDVDLQLSCAFFAIGSCSGSPLATSTAASPVDLEVVGWQEFTADLEAPEGTVAGRCELRAVAPSQEAFELRLDGASLREMPLFEDGFELGDTTAWGS